MGLERHMWATRWDCSQPSRPRSDEGEDGESGGGQTLGSLLDELS